MTGSTNMTDRATVRERVARIQKAMVHGNLQPSDIREFRAELSGMLGIANEARLQAEIQYRHRLMEIRQTTKSKADAEIQAMGEPAYEAWQQAINVCESIMEMSRSCRDNLRSLDAEIGLER